jgi:hypothetical protein
MDARIHAGEIRRHLFRRSSAVYEVLAVDDELVTVRVRHAGLLVPGTVHRFRSDDVARMELLQPAPVKAREVVYRG